MTAPTLVRVRITQDEEHAGETPADQPLSHLSLLSHHLLEQLLAHSLGIGQPLPVIV